MSASRLQSALAGSAEAMAQRLLGCELIRQYPSGQQAVVRIVETEAYDQSDAASHSYHGRTPRTDVMFGPAGHLYVYFTYGMHYCCNVVVGEVGRGSAVLIRAVEPLSGQTALDEYRPKPGSNQTNGPAKLCQALAIDRTLNGHDLTSAPLILRLRSALPPEAIVQTTRIGIRRDVERLWRFYVRGSSYISRR